MVRIFKLSWLIMAVAAVCMMCYSCGNTQTGESGESQESNINDVKIYPIGDRALFDVVGNVKSINCDSYYDTNFCDEVGYIKSKIEFDENGLLKRTSAKTIKTENGFEIHEDFFDEELREMTEIVFKYDKDGRCISAGKAADNIKYDANNHIIMYSWIGLESLADCANIYDSEGFLSERTSLMVFEDGGQERKTTYKVLAKDSNGNWTKRSVNEEYSKERIEERTIEYY